MWRATWGCNWTTSTPGDATRGTRSVNRFQQCPSRPVRYRTGLVWRARSAPCPDARKDGCTLRMNRGPTPRGLRSDVVDRPVRALPALARPSTPVEVYLPLPTGVLRLGQGRSQLTWLPVAVDPDRCLQGGFRADRGDRSSTPGRWLSAAPRRPPRRVRPRRVLRRRQRRLPDNAWRFGLLCRAALETLRAERRPVDVIHLHDWHARPAPCRCAGGMPTTRSSAGPRSC